MPSYILKLLAYVAEKRISYYCAEKLGAVLWYCSPAARIKFNRAYGGDKSPYGPNCFANKLYNLLDFFALPLMTRHKLDAKTTVINEHLFHQALAGSRPVVFLEIHSGSFFLLAVWLAYTWKKISLIHAGKSRLRKHITDLLIKDFIRSGTESFLTMQKEINQGGSYLFFLDGIKGPATEPIRLGNAEMLFSRGILSLLAKGNCVVLPVLSQRLSWNRVSLEFMPMLSPEKIKSVQDIFDRYATQLIQDPGQWYGLLEQKSAAVP